MAEVQGRRPSWITEDQKKAFNEMYKLESENYDEGDGRKTPLRILFFEDEDQFSKVFSAGHLIGGPGGST